MSLQAARVCLEQWNRAQGPQLAIRSCDVDWNMNVQKLVRYSAEQIGGVHALVGEATEAGAQTGISPKTLWVAMWGEIAPGGEKKFIEDLRAEAQKRNKSRISFGADEFHFVPGIPLNSQAGRRLAEAAKAQEFKGDEEVDYNGSLQSAAISTYIEEATQIAELKSFRLDALEVREEIEALGAFLNKEFPGRWAREFRFWHSQGDCRRAWWLGLTRGQEPDLLGFARVAVRGREVVLDSGWTPGAMRLPLFAADLQDPRWSATDSCLGPIGVAKTLRGQGAGKVLLGRVLAVLREHSARTVCIDWTNAFKYYEPLGLTEVRRYRTAFLDL